MKGLRELIRFRLVINPETNRLEGLKVADEAAKTSRVLPRRADWWKEGKCGEGPQEMELRFEIRFQLFGMDLNSLVWKPRGIWNRWRYGIAGDMEAAGGAPRGCDEVHIR